jgi:hypothetical protein
MLLPITRTGSPVVAELELTDGWYSVRAGLDFHLSQIASEGKCTSRASMLPPLSWLNGK